MFDVNHNHARLLAREFGYVYRYEEVSKKSDGVESDYSRLNVYHNDDAVVTVYVYGDREIWIFGYPDQKSYMVYGVPTDAELREHFALCYTREGYDKHGVLLAADRAILLDRLDGEGWAAFNRVRASMQAG